MKTIYKYELEITDEQKVVIHGYKSILKVAEQNGSLMLWCIVDPTMSFGKTINVDIVGTGHPINDERKCAKGGYFDTVVMTNGLVWHVFIN